jgi:hypothetical protein
MSTELITINKSVLDQLIQNLDEANKALRIIQNQQTTLARENHNVFTLSNNGNDNLFVHNLGTKQTVGLHDTPFDHDQNVKHVIVSMTYQKFVGIELCDKLHRHANNVIGTLLGVMVVTDKPKVFAQIHTDMLVDQPHLLVFKRSTTNTTPFVLQRVLDCTAGWPQLSQTISNVDWFEAILDAVFEVYKACGYSPAGGLRFAFAGLDLRLSNGESKNIPQLSEVQSIVSICQELMSDVQAHVSSTDVPKSIKIITAALEFCYCISGGCNVHDALHTSVYEWNSAAILQLRQMMIDVCSDKPTIIVKQPEDFIAQAEAQKDDDLLNSLVLLSYALQLHEQTAKISYQFKHSWTKCYREALPRCLDAAKTHFKFLIESNVPFDTEYNTKYRPVFEKLLQQTMKLKDNHWLLLLLSDSKDCFDFDTDLVKIAEPTISRDNLLLLKKIIKEQDGYLLREFLNFTQRVLTDLSQSIQEVWKSCKSLYYHFDYFMKADCKNFEIHLRYQSNPASTENQLVYSSLCEHRFTSFFQVYSQVFNHFFAHVDQAYSQPIFDKLSSAFVKGCWVELLHYNHHKFDSDTVQFCRELIKAFKQVQFNRLGGVCLK